MWRDFPAGNSACLATWSVSHTKAQELFSRRKSLVKLLIKIPFSIIRFPLGRYYEDGGFKYILQIHECKKTSRSKIKVRKWVDTPDFRNYEKFVCDWHYFLLDIQSVLYESEDSDLIRNLNMYVVNQFYRKPYDEKRDFYEQFYERLAAGKELLSLGV